ncbi:hypothetical protein IWQ56_002331 [Coemansia nantahalensis]|uniref:Uncharacterized protein n=2 Tax=Coemansia TaxID=4863 RepID=A0ACC1KYB3_9FUNG|nr:hypothetical protein IWQ56_002331 [Coemansia nantahalensis]KAJ2773044.1 hypothetical protein IWQ57_001486 [Coemansia nantahalensis]KAJ2797731.1 hypothetical protein H4R21_004201 [Coemansia helicoidea]
MKLTILISLLAAAAAQVSAGRCPHVNPVPDPAPAPSDTATPAPTGGAPPAPGNPDVYYAVTLDQLNKAVPDAAADNYCSLNDRPKSCVNNKIAVDAINKAMTKYQIKRRGEAVAVIATMALESGYWQYNMNDTPGRPGQGTRAMLMYNFVYEYAKYLFPDAVKAEWKGLEFGTAENNKTMNDVAAMVIADEPTSFGAGFWYLSKSTTGFYNNDAALRDGNVDDFKGYLVDGIHTTAAEERITIWNKFNEAL